MNQVGYTYLHDTFKLGVFAPARPTLIKPVTRFEPTLEHLLQRGGLRHERERCLEGMAINRFLRKEIEIHRNTVSQAKRNGRSAVQREP